MPRLIRIALSLLLASPMLAQQPINPTYINWPVLSGADTPTATGAVCDVKHVSEPYLDTAVVPNTSYTCQITTASPLAYGWALNASAAPQVSTVFGRTGTIAAQTGDYTAAQVGADASGAAAAVLAASAQRASNLSDIASASTARTNLGLGTAATQPSSAFAAPVTATAAGQAPVSTGAGTTYTAQGVVVGFSNVNNNTNIGGGIPIATTGSGGNVAVGAGTMNSTATGNSIFNTAIGEYSMQNMSGTETYNNTAVGQLTLQSVASQGNTAMGTQALQELVGGDGGNTALGSGALQWLVSGAGDVAVGQNASFWTGYNSSGASGNTAIGDNSLGSNPTGDNNIAIGPAALQGNMTQVYPPTGTQSTFSGEIAIGNTTMYNDVNGSNNIGIGSQVMQYMTSGIADIAIGTQAMQQLTTGSANIAIGYLAMSTGAITGVDNIGIGDGTMTPLTTGSYNTVVGHAAMINANTGSYNTIFGYQASEFSSVVADEVAIGYFAFGQSNESYSVGVGADAEPYNSSGQQNVAIGYQALFNATSGNNSVVIGYQAGLTSPVGGNVLSCQSCVLVGEQTQPNNSTDSSEIVIGTSAQGNGTNTATIGNSSITATYLYGVTYSTGAFATSAPKTTVNCSASGSATFSQPFQGASDKRVLIHLAACIGTASYTYPTAFTNTPSIYASNNIAASIATSVSTTAVTVTGATTTGSLVLEDY